MRRFAAILIVLMATTALADATSEHLDHLRAMMHAMAQHGPVIPQPEAIQTQATVTIAITARSFNFSPSSFTVNQGDIVTLTVTVPSNDPSTIGHGVLLDTYVDPGLDCPRGKTVTTTFTATTPGKFPWVCTQPSCGTGHSSMLGQMIVNAVAGPQIASISPNSGSTSGGTAITITGSDFQSGATVTLGGIAATNVNVMNSTTITATTPLGPPTEQLVVDVVVTNPDNTSATLHQGFTYSVPPLAVTTITPSSAPAGAMVTITGAGFTTALSSSVVFGGVPATTVSIVSPITMQVVAPPHALGSVGIDVTIGGTTVSKPAAFTYVLPPPRRRSARH